MLHPTQFHFIPHNSDIVIGPEKPTKASYARGKIGNRSLNIKIKQRSNNKEMSTPTKMIVTGTTLSKSPLCQKL